MLLSSILLLFSKAGLTEETVKDVDGFVFPVGYEDSSGIEVAAKDLSEHIVSVGSDINLNSEYHSSVNLPLNAPNTRYGVNYDNKWYNYSDVGNYYSDDKGTYKGLHPGEDWNLGGKGVDLGKSVFAIANGQVILRRDWTSTGRGFCYVIKHKINKNTTIIPYAGGNFEKQPDYIYSKYLHVTGDLEDNAVVEKGQKIFTIADVSLSRMQSHLHFEIQEKDNGCVYPNAGQNNGYYKTNYDATSKNYKVETERVFDLMKKDGILDPSDFINANKKLDSTVQPPSVPTNLPQISAVESFGVKYGLNDLVLVESTNRHELKFIGINVNNTQVQWKNDKTNWEAVSETPKITDDKVITFSFDDGPDDEENKVDENIYFRLFNNGAVSETVTIKIIATPPFSDLNDTTAKYNTAMSMLKDKGFVQGYPVNGKVKPEDLINRAEFAKIISIAHKGNPSYFDEQSEKCSSNFKDIQKNFWACEYLNYAYANKIINGYLKGIPVPCKNSQKMDDGDYFCPEEKITYQEALKMIFKAVFKSDNLIWVDDNSKPTNSYVGCAESLGLFGKDANDNSISVTANSSIKRGEVFFALHHAMQLVKANSGKKLNQNCAFQ